MYYILGKIIGCKYLFIDFKYICNFRNFCGVLFVICLIDCFWDYINFVEDLYMLLEFVCLMYWKWEFKLVDGVW